MFEDHRAHLLEVDAIVKAIVGWRLFAPEKFAQFARESFVILTAALRGLAIHFHFAGEIAQGGLGLRAMLAVLVPVVRPKGEKTPIAISATSMNRLKNDLPCSPPPKLMRASITVRQRTLQA